MKKLTLALLVLSTFSATAQAESSVTIYGRVDLGLAKSSGAATTALPNADELVQRKNHPSLLGFKGVEDLGGGLSAVFWLETEMAADTGAAGSSTNFWDRQAAIGLVGSFGTVKLGRTKGLVAGAEQRVDPFTTEGVIGDYTTPVLRAGKISQSRVNNAVTYNSPNFSGFVVSGQYMLSEIKDADAGVEILATYDNGPFSFHAGYEKPAQASATAVKPYMYVVGGGYKFGDAKINAAYSRGDSKVAPVAATATAAYVAGGIHKGYLVGLTYKVGAGDAKIIYAKQKDANTSTVEELGVGYDYHISKRTDLYAYAGSGKQLAFKNNYDSVSHFQVGISHKF